MATEPELEDFDIDLSDGGFPHNEINSGIGTYQHPEEETYETRLEAARKSILGKRDFTSPLSADDFFEQFKDITDKSSTKGAGNLLHVLVGGVKHNDLQPKHVEPLVRGLVDEAPDLLKDKNKEGQTPVLMAIRTCQDQLLSHMISACVEHPNQELATKSFNEALTMKQEGKTALHVAFMENLDAKTLWILVQNASDEAPGSKDQAGRTPMHYAVNFSRCKSSRMSLIDLFIQRDSRARFNKPRSAETFLDICDNQYCSVFQEHQNTRTSTCARYSDRPKATATPKRDFNDPLRETDRPTIRDPKPHDSSRELKPIPETRISGEREAARSGRGSHPLAPSDEHERKRQVLKELERVRQGNSDTSARNDQPTERDSAMRDISRYRSSRTNDPDEVTQSRALHSSQQPDLRSNTGVKRSNTFRDESKHGEGVKPTAKQRSGNDNEKVIKLINYLKANSDIVLKKLKLHYMRTRNPEMVILFLYGKNMNDIQTAFDYRGLPSPITWKEFNKMFGESEKDGYKFDTVLQYATFPRVKVHATGRAAAMQSKRLNEDKSNKPGAKSREDLKYFLDWLYNKGVRHIIRLSVEDSGDSSQEVHSDEVIQAGLARFSVEHLDWQKVDLDPETILHIGSQVPYEGPPSPEDLANANTAWRSSLQKLTLLWSGSNAALRAWGDQEALPMLPCLREVEIIQPPARLAYDSQSWIDQKIKDFERRLNRNRPRQRLKPNDNQETSIDDTPYFERIRVKLVESIVGSGLGDTSNSVYPLDTSAPDQNQWLQSVENFARSMNPYWESTVQKFLEARQHQGTPEGVENDVTIALIDDGVYKFGIGRPHQVLQGKSFDFHGDRLNPPYLSAKGHGTVMASMILRVCPMAKIYPIRLKTNSDASGNSTIDPGYAARAIQAALDKKATIISMSWTVSMKEGEDGSKKLLHDVLQRAVDNKVLMFCCAPDHGKFKELDYPSGPWQENFFRVGAAHSSGKVFEWTPSDITYLLPGVDVVQDKISRIFPDSASERDITHLRKNLTGSSVSAALGAGLAAMIIYCVKAGILAAKTAKRDEGSINAIPDDGAIQISKPDAMKKAFKSLGSVTENRFIQVWERLDKATEILERWERERERSNPEALSKCIEEFTRFTIKLANSAV
ncbi:hypothetical protein ACHAP7_005001 [Fusarium lateritium]